MDSEAADVRDCRDSLCQEFKRGVAQSERIATAQDHFGDRRFGGDSFQPLVAGGVPCS